MIAGVLCYLHAKKRAAAGGTRLTSVGYIDTPPTFFSFFLLLHTYGEFDTTQFGTSWFGLFFFFLFLSIYVLALSPGLVVDWRYMSNMAITYIHVPNVCHNVLRCPTPARSSAPAAPR